MTSRQLLSFVSLAALLTGVVLQAVPAPQAEENSVDKAELRAGIERENDIPLPA